MLNLLVSVSARRCNFQPAFSLGQSVSGEGGSLPIRHVEDLLCRRLGGKGGFCRQVIGSRKVFLFPSSSSSSVVTQAFAHIPCVSWCECQVRPGSSSSSFPHSAAGLNQHNFLAPQGFKTSSPLNQPGTGDGGVTRPFTRSQVSCIYLFTHFAKSRLISPCSRRVGGRQVWGKCSVEWIKMLSFSPRCALALVTPQFFMFFFLASINSEATDQFVRQTQ